MKDKPEKTLPKDFGDVLKDIPTVDEVVDVDEDLMAEDDLNIPILTDIAAETLKKEEAAKSTTEAADNHQALVQALLEHGASRTQMQRIIDDLVAEHMPRLEQQLRVRLHTYLASLKAAGNDRD